MFSEVTRSLLEQAGWSEERRVDTSEYERLLQTEGYPVHPIQLEFLARFGGLYITFQFRGQERDFHFDVALAVAHAFPQNNEMDSRDVGLPLSLIGERHRSHALLKMAPEGKVYSIVDDYIDLVGSSGEDAIEAMCTGRPGIPIYPPDS